MSAWLVSALICLIFDHDWQRRVELTPPRFYREYRQCRRCGKREG